jgi:uncharacterized membrane protein YfcA
MVPALQAGFVAAGLVAGFTAGLVGIGGGVLMVPFLYFFYESARGAALGGAVPPDLQATVSHATSLFVIVPTAILGTAAYARAGLVVWRAALPVGLFSLAGGVLGARIALGLPADALKLGFGIFLIATAAQLIRSTRGGEGHPLRLALPITVPTGIVVGVFSAILGVGGGLVAIPLLMHVIGVDIRRVAATSLAIIVMAATAGTLTYMVTGSGVSGLPASSVGYVHVAAGVPLMIGSLFTVRLGAIANQRMKTPTLRRVFAAVLAALGLRLILQAAGALW